MQNRINNNSNRPTNITNSTVVHITTKKKEEKILEKIYRKEEKKEIDTYHLAFYSASFYNDLFCQCLSVGLTLKRKWLLVQQLIVHWQRHFVKHVERFLHLKMRCKFIKINIIILNASAVLIAEIHSLAKLSIRNQMINFNAKIAIFHLHQRMFDQFPISSAKTNTFYSSCCMCNIKIQSGTTAKRFQDRHYHSDCFR